MDRKHIIQSLVYPFTKEIFIIPRNGWPLILLDCHLFPHCPYPIGGSPCPSHKALLIPNTKPFQKLQGALLQGLALHFPDLTHPFSLCVTGKEGYALGVLGHQLGSFFIVIVYLSKEVDLTRDGYPAFML